MGHEYLFGLVGLRGIFSVVKAVASKGGLFDFIEVASSLVHVGKFRFDSLLPELGGDVLSLLAVNSLY